MRKRLEQSEEKTATRIMFYDEQGRHVRTKKEIPDGDGNIRRGCKIIKSVEQNGSKPKLFGDIVRAGLYCWSQFEF